AADRQVAPNVAGYRVGGAVHDAPDRRSVGNRNQTHCSLEGAGAVVKKEEGKYGHAQHPRDGGDGACGDRWKGADRADELSWSSLQVRVDGPDEVTQAERGRESVCLGRQAAGLLQRMEQLHHLLTQWWHDEDAEGGDDNEHCGVHRDDGESTRNVVSV